MRPPPTPATPSPSDGLTAPRAVLPRTGTPVDLGALGIHFLIRGAESGGPFSLAEHVLPPRTLCNPLHRYARADDCYYVIEGRLGVQIGDAVVYADAGHIVLQPRNEWHTCWNAGDGPCRFRELVADFEHFFADGPAPDGVSGAGCAAECDPESVVGLCRAHHLTFPDP